MTETEHTLLLHKEECHFAYFIVGFQLGPKWEKLCGGKS
jgi:hypothetical protein